MRRNIIWEGLHLLHVHDRPSVLYQRRQRLRDVHTGNGVHEDKTPIPKVPISQVSAMQCHAVPCSAMQKSFSMSQSPCIDLIQKQWHFGWPSWECTALVWLENTSLSEDQSHLRNKGELESHWIGVRTKEIDQRVAANHQNPATKCFNHHTKTQSAIVCVCVSAFQRLICKKKCSFVCKYGAHAWAETTFKHVASCGTMHHRVCTHTHICQTVHYPTILWTNLHDTGSSGNIPISSFACPRKSCCAHSRGKTGWAHTEQPTSAKKIYSRKWKL